MTPKSPKPWPWPPSGTNATPSRESRPDPMQRQAARDVVKDGGRIGTNRGWIGQAGIGKSRR